MQKKFKNFSIVLLMLVLLMNLSSFMHTMLHVHIAPQSFCIAQHDTNAAPHLESRYSPIPQNNECAVCEYEKQNNISEVADNDFSINSQKINIESCSIPSFESITFFYSSSRAPPAV